MFYGRYIYGNIVLYMLFMSTDKLYTFPAVRRWLGNPLALAVLRFMAREDGCGDRLTNALNYYLDPTEKYCWKCNIAGRTMAYMLQRSGVLFGIDEEDMHAGLSEPVFQRGLKNVLEGIAHYGITMPQVVNAPFLVVWDCTHRCNLRCTHCYQDAQRALPHELDTDEAKALMDELVEAGVVIVAFSGGEPLMRKDFFEVAEYAHRQGLYLALATNGTLVTREMARRIHEAGIEYVEISIDGKDAESHDAMRGIPGVFDSAVEGIKNCVDEGIYTCIATTVTRSNYDQIPAIYDLATDLGVRRLMCFNFIPTGRGAGMADQDISPEQRRDLIQFLLAKDEEREDEPEALSTAPQIAPIAIEDDEYEGIPLGHFYSGRGVEGRTELLADFIGGCGAGRLYCSIEPEGEVQPCVFLPITVGNVRDTPFAEIWHSSEVFKKLRDRSHLAGSCGECENGYVCGGCRARAWAYFRDLDAPDPGCVRNLKEWRALKASEGGGEQGEATLT